MKKLVIALLIGCAGGFGMAHAQNSSPGGVTVQNSSGESSVNAAANAKPANEPTKSNPSGSGTSTSGGKDDNGDGGRDKMPDSNKDVMPLSKQNEMKKK